MRTSFCAWTIDSMVLMGNGWGPRGAGRQAAGCMAVWGLHAPVWGDCSLESLYMRGVRRSALAARQSGPVCRMDSHPRSTEALKREVSADGGGSLVSSMRGLWPDVWPGDRRGRHVRRPAAWPPLLAAKLATIAVPFTFKWATDALIGEGSAPVAPSAWLVWALAAPILMTIAYGGTRILMALLTQMRDGVFAQVAMNAVRRLAYRPFEHMHELSLRLHLQRKTGRLTRVLERGRNAIETIVRMVIMQLVPTIIELALILIVLLYQFDWRYVVVILAVVALYMAFTYQATEWRINIRRRMNDSDTDANV